MNRKHNAKKYFIHGFKSYIKNENKSLSKIYTPSIRELLLDYVEIYEDITINLELEKLKKARKDIIEAIIYYIKNCILYENISYKRELTLLIEQMESLEDGEEKEKFIKYSHIYNICNSLIKKIDSDNIYFHIISLVKNYDSFSQIDKAIHFIINELLYEGYSLKFLEAWFKERIGNEKISEENIDSILNRFYDLKQEKKAFVYYINVLENDYFKNDELCIDFNRLLTKQDIKSLNLMDKMNNEDVGKFLQVTNGYNICRIEIKAMDYYKGLDDILNSIKSYFHMITYVSSETKKIFLEKLVCQLPDETYKKIRLKENDISNDTDVLFSKIENRERQDVEDFIEYRHKVFSDNIKSQEIFNIQRALNIVKNQLYQSQENKIINLWAVLEYILTFKESGGSIIAKVKDIIPKIVCLYIMKDKINIFWNRIFEQKDKKIAIIDEFLKCKKIDDDYQYDLSTLIRFISEKGSSLIKELEFNDILSRDIAEIGKFMSDPKALFQYLELKKQEITHDLVRIYRARNVLIHSGKETRIDLNCKSLRLYSYNNNLLGLIIYYMCKNPNFTITEILNSIDYTYENYMKSLENRKINIEEVSKPKYLFIG